MYGLLWNSCGNPTFSSLNPVWICKFPAWKLNRISTIPYVESCMNAVWKFNWNFLLNPVRMPFGISIGRSFASSYSSQCGCMSSLPLWRLHWEKRFSNLYLLLLWVPVIWEEYTIVKPSYNKSGEPEVVSTSCIPYCITLVISTSYFHASWVSWSLWRRLEKRF